MSVNSKMTAIADRIRTLTGSSSTMGLDAMADQLGEANNEVSTQADLIEQILIALQGKASGGGSDTDNTTAALGSAVLGSMKLA